MNAFHKLIPFKSIWECIRNIFSDYRILTDLDAPKGAHLMGPHEEGSLNIVTLMLTGRATPYLHNGVVYVGDEDHYVRIDSYFVQWNNEKCFTNGVGITSIRNTFSRTSRTIGIRE